MLRTLPIILTVALACLTATPLTAWGAPPFDAAKRGAADAEVAGLIVRYAQPGKGAALVALPAAERTARIAAALGDGAPRPVFQRVDALGQDVLLFDAPRTLAEGQALAAAAARLPGVEAAWPNRIMRIQAVPLDAQYGLQWGFGYTPGSSEGANFEAAWNVTRGDPGHTIGVVDSGIALGHREFVGRLRLSVEFPNGGYDFMSSATLSGDGDGRDDDPSQLPNSCGHGTHVAGTIGARTAFAASDPADDAAGGAPVSKLLIARGLNFTGLESDLIDAMLWLAGDPVPGVAVNPNPVRAINMSFGGSGACGAYQPAFDRLLALGVVPVVAAGNQFGADAGQFAPSNCRGAVSVAASDSAGSLAGFSNKGPSVTLTAPGDGILSVGGTTDGVCFKNGTSMATPHVTAAVALMHAVNPALTVAQTTLGLRAGARAFPAGSNCTTTDCGAGLLDALGAIDAVLPSATARIGSREKSVSVRENDGSATLTLSRIGSPSAALSVTVTAIPGTAASGVDYSPPASPVTWPAGDMTDKTVSLPILYRPGEQGARTLSLALSSATATVVAPGVIPVRITEVDCASVTPISMGQTLSGHIGQPGETYCRGGVRGPEFDTVRYRFTGTAGQVVSIDLVSTTPASAGVLDPYLYLLDADKRVLVENDDITAGLDRNSRLRRFVLPSSGDYFIDATTWSPIQDARGTYSLHLYGCGLYVPGAACNLDVDGDQAFDRIDAQLALRHLFGYAPAALREGLPTSDACVTRTGASLAAFIDTQRTPVAALGNLAPLDLDGNGRVEALTDGLMLLRVTLGLTGTAVTANALGDAPTRSDWAAIRTYLNGQCGLSLP